MDAVELRRYWRKAEDTAAVSSDERVALLDLSRDGQPPLILEGTAAAIWTAVRGQSLEELAAELAARYEAMDPGALLTDISRFLAQLEVAGVVSPC